MRSRATKSSILDIVALTGGPVFFVIVWLVYMARGGVWAPDVLLGNQRTLASSSLANGHRFRVEQHWNNSDFYSTALHITAPDGKETIHTLDGDDVARWKVPMRVNEDRRTVGVTVGGRTKSIRW